MKKAIYAAIENRKVTIFLVILVAFLGVYNYQISPKQESPDIAVPTALLVTVYPGASPEDVELFITDKIEEKAGTIEGFSSSTSDSVNSVSIVAVELENGADIDSSWDELRRVVDEVQSELPEGSQKTTINTELDLTAGIIVSMSGDDYTYEELADYGEVFKNKLKKIDGISKFEVIGEQEKQVSIEIESKKLNQYSLTLEEISKLIYAQNLDIPTGKFEDENGKINVMAKGTFSSIEEIRNIIVAISEETGVVLRLKDIATVEMDLKDDSNYKIKQNGKNAILLTGYFQDNQNIVSIGKEVEQEIEILKKDLPEDIIFDEVLYQPRDVSESVNSFMLNLLEGIAFVIIVVFIGMGFRNAIVVSTAIPVSLLMTFVIMGALDIKIHQISISALIIALGMLVDNAIVISDWIQVRIDRGEDKLDACVNGAKEVAMPVLASTLTTVGAFVPLLLLNSLAGQFIISVPQIVMIALAASYIVAMFVTPTMAYLFFKPSKKAENEDSKVRKVFENMLNFGLEKKKTVLALVIGCAVFAGILFQYIGLQFFPNADNNIVYIDVEAEQLDIDKTEKLVDSIVKVLEDQPEILSYTTAIGDALPKFFYSLPIKAQSEDFAQMMLRVDHNKLGKKERFKNKEQLVDYLQEEISSEVVGGTATVKLLAQGKPLEHPVMVRVLGDDLNEISGLAQEIENILKDINGTVNVDNDYVASQYEYDVDVNVDVASNYGISKVDIQKETSIALRGTKASMFIDKDKEYPIKVKSDMKTKSDLENFAIKSTITGNKVLIKQVADIKLVAKTVKISRYEGEKAIKVFSDVQDGFNSVKIQDELEEKINKLDLDGATIAFAGEREDINEEFGDMLMLSVFSILIIYLVLLMQFGSLIQPLVIMVTIPFAIVGSIIGLFVAKQPFSFTALLGIVSLLGIVVNNAIVLIDYINFERNVGKGIEESCRDAVSKRFRPIILSTTTTLIGLVPLVFSGSALFAPMSITLISGLAISTLLTLILIPIMYSVIEGGFEKRKERKMKLKKAEK